MRSKLICNQQAVSNKPTLLDVARGCGVTKATVSRVLNNKKKNFTIPQALRQRIWNKTHELGYVLNTTARTLSMGTTKVVGLFASSRTGVAEGINQALIEGIAETLDEGGYEVYIGLTPIQSAKNRLPLCHFDGAILMPDPKPETVMELDMRGVPYVCVNERVGRAVAHVLADDAMGMNAAISHLTQLGHKRFAYANVRLADATHYSVHDRYQTLLTAAGNGTIQLVDGCDLPMNSPADFIQATVVKGGATAVIAFDHRKAAMLLGAAYSMGLRVPQDFSLICFNDVFPTAMLYPALTTIMVAGQEMGRTGANILLNYLHSPQVFANKDVRVAETLVLRDSTAPVTAQTRS